MDEIENLPKNLEDIVEKMRSRLKDANGHWSEQHNAIREELDFTCAGNQWASSGSGFGVIDKDRPNLVSNQTLTLCQRVINTIRMNPFGIQVSTNEDNATQLIQDKIRQIEYESRASESYENAFECQVVAGMGFYYITTEYLNDTDLEQKVSVKSIIDPTCAFLDPFCEEIDGSDSKFGFIRNALDKKHQVDVHGEEVLSGNIAGIDLSCGVTDEADKVYQLIYYYKDTSTVKRYFLYDGSFTDEEPEDDSLVDGTRIVEIDKVYCCEFIGNKFIQRTEVIGKYIPLIPVLGDRLRSNQEKLYWGGLTRRVKDSAMMVNYYKNNEAEQVALAPKAPFIAAYGQIEQHIDLWRDANNSNIAVLPYDPVTISGVVLPAPQRSTAAVNTAPVIQSRIQAQQDMSMESGIFIDQLGGQATAGQSGLAVKLRDGQSELTNAQYLDNFKKSMNQAGRVIIAMIIGTSDTERIETFRKDDGETYKKTVNLSEIMTKVDDLDVSVSSGPAYQNRRKESVAQVNELMTGNPELKAVIADIMVDNMDAPASKEIASRLKKMLPPELQEREEGAPDPQALEALKQQEEIIEEQEKMLEQLQHYIVTLENSNQNEIKKAQMQETSDIIQTEMKINADIEKETLKQDGENERKLMDIATQGKGEINELAEEAISENIQIPDL